MSKDLAVLMASKDDSHYGVSMVGREKALSPLRRARRLVDAAHVVVDASA